MKWLLLILMVLSGIAIFQYRDEIREKIGGGTSTEKAPPKEVVDKGTGEGDEAPVDPGTKRTDRGTTKPSTNTIPKTSRPGTIAETDEAAKRYPMPQFKTLAEAVGNWKAIPSNAFPRQIVLNAPVKVVLEGGVGSSTWKAGSQAFALRADDNILTVGKTREAMRGGLRGQIPLDQTNFKDVLQVEFNNWKRNQEAIVMKQRARYREVLAQSKAQPASSNTPSRNEAGLLANEKELGKKPEQKSDGTVPVMIASLQRKDVTEIRPDIIEDWGPVIREVVNGKPYWTATVGYKTVSMFGEINTEAQALMRNGKVIQWLYTGSGETVP